MRGNIKYIFYAGLVYYLFRIGRKMYAQGTETGKEQEIDTVARTLYGEARGEGTTGMRAVANVIMNRVAKGGWWGTTFEEVCKKKSQFSCWLENDPNYQKLLTVDKTDRQFIDAYLLAEQAVNNNLPDITGGATHYHTKAVNPSWASSGTVTATIGNHIFYRGVA